MKGFEWRAGKRRFCIDIESTSTVDLRKAGAAAYWAHPETQIIVVVWRVDDGDVHVWRPGDGVPYFVPELSGAYGGAWRVVAHNWLFEYNAWIHKLGPKYGWNVPSMSVWDCTMARSLYWGFPAGLGDVCEAMKLPVVKDADARPLMLRMARPRTTHPTLTWWHETDPDKLQGLTEYCVQDVLAECCLDDALPDLPDIERRIFLVDGEINQRGVAVDVDLVNQLQALTVGEIGRLNGEMARLTNGCVTTTNQIARLHGFLAELQCPMSGFDKGTVAEALAELDGLEDTRDGLLARDVLLVRQEAAKASTAKLSAMLHGLSPDRRARGLLQYGGAGRTMRWAGRRVQPQNYPRGSVKGLDNILPLILAGAPRDDLVMLIPGTVMDLVSSSLRACFVPSPGKVFVSADLAQIEARVVAWLAGQRDILRVFARGEDVYTYTARQIGSNSRQLGKVLVLACVAEGSPVLTDKGLVPVECVTRDMRVWDGVEWVEHDGVVCRGEKEVIEYDGLCATPDHLVWTEGRSDPVPFGDAASTVARLVRSGRGGTPLRVLGSPGPGIRAEGGEPKAEMQMHVLRGGANGRLDHLAQRQVKGVSVSVPVEYGPVFGTVDARGFGADGVRPPSLPKPERPAMGPLRGTRDHIRLSDYPGGCRVGGREPGAAYVGCSGDRPDRQQGELRAGQFALGDARNADAQYVPDQDPRAAYLGKPLFADGYATTAAARSQQGRDIRDGATGGCGAAEKLAGHRRKTRVYDVVNAGPRHRFTVSGRLCHNCGFGMGPDRFRETAATYGVMLDVLAAEEAVYGWRELNAQIVKLWWDVDRIAKRIAQAPDGTEEKVGLLTFRKARKALQIILPNGEHKITYHSVEVGIGEGGREELTFLGVNPLSKKWERLRTYGGKLVENCVQAIARDIMAHAMVELARRGVQLVLTIHDELLAECAPAEAVEIQDLILLLLRRGAKWMRGLPINAESWIGPRHRKG